MSKPYITRETLTGLDIDACEKHYGAKFIGDFCIKNSDGNYVDMALAVFYQPNPNLELGHSHYFALYIRNGLIYITKGDSAFDDPITAILDSDGELVYSRYHHDFRGSKEGGALDGGRSYCRQIGSSTGIRPTVQFTIQDGEIILL